MLSARALTLLPTAISKLTKCAAGAPTCRKMIFACILALAVLPQRTYQSGGSTAKWRISGQWPQVKSRPLKKAKAWFENSLTSRQGNKFSCTCSVASSGRRPDGRRRRGGPRELRLIDRHVKLRVLT